MSTPPAGTIVFEDVSKRYRFGATASLRDALTSLAHLSSNSDERTLWALRHVSFRVEPGESLGLIGPNGAGKTTTLKLLSNITQPTTGRIAVGGRLSSLIELGAGFHPELTGRENIFLNGAILGLKHAEVKRKFDEIVAFSELERFIDTPVKRYSSGMYVRLGFAVAAHVEPDVLIVDEVLAVGDASFRQKCVLRMDYLRQKGTTLLFVSHSMHLVQRLCHRSALLWKGELVFEGPAADAIAMYERRISESAADAKSEGLQSALRLTRIGLTGDGGGPASDLQHGDQITLTFDYVNLETIVSPVIRVRLLRGDGFVVAMMATHHQDQCSPITLGASGQVSLTIPAIEVLSGTYFFDVRVLDPTDSQVLAAGRSDEFYVSSPGFGYEVDRGIYRPQVKWEVTRS